MKKTIILFLLNILLLGGHSHSQFTESQIDELTALGIYSALEPDNAAVQKITSRLAGDFEEGDLISRFCSVFDHLYGGWNYSKDPFGQEYFEKAGVSIHTLTGDCDDYSILMVSMLKSLGGDGRIICVSGHAFPEMYLGRDLTNAELAELTAGINNYYELKGSRTRVKRLNYHGDADGTFWLNMDYQQRHPGGRFWEYSADADHLVIYSDGSYKRAFLNGRN